MKKYITLTLLRAKNWISFMKLRIIFLRWL